MRGLPYSVSACSNQAKLFSPEEEARRRIGIGQVCVVVHSPLRPQNGYDMAPNTEVTLIDDNAGACGNDISALTCKDINAFVHARDAPWLVPERLGIPVFGGSTGDRNQGLIRNCEPDAEHYSENCEKDIQMAICHLL